MATLSFSQFSKGQPVTVVGNEGKQKEPIIAPNQDTGVMSRLRKTVSDTSAEMAGTKQKYQSGDFNLPTGVATNFASLSKGVASGVTDVAQSIPVIGDVITGAKEQATKPQDFSKELADTKEQYQTGQIGLAQGVGQNLTTQLKGGFVKVQDLISKGLDTEIGKKIMALPQAQDIADAIEAHPQVIQNLKNLNDVANAYLVVSGAGEATGAAGNLAKNLTTKGLEATSKVLPDLTVDGIANAATKLKNDIQISTAKKNVTPQLESSASRLTTGQEEPLVAYNIYSNQAKNSLTDIKADSPIAEVGSKIGDAFNQVVKQRRDVGATIGEELKNVGKLRVSTVEPKTSMLTELKDSGLSYNPKTNELTSFQGSKFASEEVSMLNDFNKGIQALGDNPTISQIDNFISKTRSDLNFTKGKSGVIGTTNAERIINGTLSGLRETLNPEKNGLPELAKYWQANKTYTELSNFVDEGATHLGKITQSGDFAKDASVAKSSVQSILNSGKKDWLIKLEGLTGYQAIDDSVLALQAMKDAGDFRGLSLLQTMQEAGGIPTSKAGFVQKILDMAVTRGEKLISGTPEEQTRALLQDLSNKAKTHSTPSTPTIVKPTGGQSTQSIKSSNPSVIQPNSTTVKKKVNSGNASLKGIENFKKHFDSLNN